MRVFADEKRIARRRRIGEIAPLVGLVVLLGSVVMVFTKPKWIWASMAVVWTGFIVSLVGSYLGERYVGPNAHYRRIQEALKGLDRTYTLLMYRLSAPFVVIEPGGVTVLTVKPQGGEITYSEGRWRHRQSLGILRRLAGQETIGHPERVAVAEREAVEETLLKTLPEGVKVPVRAVIVFIHPEAHLTIEDASLEVPAVRARDLKRWFRRNPLRPRLSDEAWEALQSALGLAEVEETAMD